MTSYQIDCACAKNLCQNFGRAMALPALPVPPGLETTVNGRLYLAYRTTGTGCGPETLTLKISTTQRLQWSALAGRCLDRCKISLTSNENFRLL